MDNEINSGGFIKLHRKLMSHWVWSDADRLKWWIDILFSVNYLDDKCLIHGELIECKRGQSLFSLDTWAKRWRVDKSKVRRFLDMLENDKMIVVEGLRKTTRLTVCNYESYNGNANTKSTQKTSKQHPADTQTTPIEEGKEGEESKEKNTAALLQSAGFNKPVILVAGWEEFKAYQRSHFRSTYKNEKSENIALAKLFRLSAGNELMAGEILKESISNKWQGFFALKNQNNGNFQQPRTNNPRTAGANSLLASLKGPASTNT